MKNSSSTVTHLVKLINTTDTIITEDKSSTEAQRAVIKLILCLNNYTTAHVCSTVCLVSGSFITYAVSPTALEPLPEVYWPLGIRWWTYWREEEVMSALHQ